jgi:16S rRNA (cytosine1402-N4)-methyltransferase
MGKRNKKTDSKQSTGQPFNASGDPYHIPVLLEETINGLKIQPGGVYVDCTMGGAGHSRALLEKLDNTGKLVAFDQDEDSVRNLPDDPRVTFVPHNFRHVKRFLRLHNIEWINGIMADLGVSSYQFDQPGRGFSYRFDAPMDMRMDRRQPLTAYEVVNTYSEQQLQKLFSEYGEVTNAKTLARTIVAIRKTQSLQTIESFKNALREIVKGNPNKYFAQVFQALRIEVNDELGAIRELLEQIPQLLKPGGRAALITFHSLEDRLVKNFFRRGAFEEQPDTNPFINVEKVNELRVITKKPVLPSEEEIKMNPRSRSAKLRIAEKVMMV